MFLKLANLKCEDQFGTFFEDDESFQLLEELGYRSVPKWSERKDILRYR